MKFVSEIGGVVSRLSFSLAIIVLLALAGLTLAPSDFGSVDSEAEPITDCSDIDNELEYYQINTSGVSDSSIEASTNQDSVVLNIPEGMSGEIRFGIDNDNIKILSSTGLVNTEPGVYTYQGDSESRVEYSLDDGYSVSGVPSLGMGIRDGSGYTVLPESSEPYTIRSGGTVNNPVVYLGENINKTSSTVGCQEITQIYPESAEVDGDINTIRDVSGHVPFNRNYSDINIYYNPSEFDTDEEYNGVAVGNDIMIYTEADRDSTIIHEYIHTRQALSEWDNEYTRPWFTEGSAQYYTNKIMYELDMISYQNYKTNMVVSSQLLVSNTSELYESDNAVIDHYNFGTAVFYSYNQRTDTDFRFDRLPYNKQNEFANYYKDSSSESLELCTSSLCTVTVKPSLTLYNPTVENIIWLVSAAIPIYLLLETVHRIRRHLIPRILD